MTFLGLHLSEAHKKKLSLAKKGTNNPNWLNGKVKYRGLHKWLCDNFPKQKKCYFCKKENAKVYDWANVTGIYDRNIENYRETCRGCHIKLDRWNSLLFITQP